MLTYIGAVGKLGPYVLILGFFDFEAVLLIRDIVREAVRRSREPDVEQEVKRRLSQWDLVVAHPVVPDVPPWDKQKYQSRDCELFPTNMGRRTTAALGMSFTVLIILSALTHGSTIVLIVWLPAMVVGVVAVIVCGPSWPARVRNQVRITQVASHHGGEYVTINHPGDGWDLPQLTQVVHATSRDWNAMSDQESQVKSGLDATRFPQRLGKMSICEEQAIFTIRFESAPRYEYGRTKLRTIAGNRVSENKQYFYFYILAEVNPSFQLCVRRRTYLDPAEQRHPAPDDSVLDPLFETEPGCQEVFERLSAKTRQMMADARLDKMVIAGGWAMFWWDGDTNWGGGMHLGGGMDWDGDMEMASEKTWAGVDKVRGVLASIENDFSK